MADFHTTAALALYRPPHQRLFAARMAADQEHTESLRRILDRLQSIL